MLGPRWAGVHRSLLREMLGRTWEGREGQLWGGTRQ